MRHDPNDLREIEDEFCSSYLGQLESIIVEFGRDRDRSLLSGGARVWALLPQESRVRILARWKDRQGWGERHPPCPPPDPGWMAELDEINRAAIVVDRGFRPKNENNRMNTYILMEPTKIPLWKKFLHWIFI